MSIIKDSYIFIHNPKTAGSAMEEVFGGKSHETLYGYSQETDIDKYFKWMFVRNPYDRIVSSYQYHLSHEYIWPMSFKCYTEKLTDFFDFSSENYWQERDNCKRPHLIPQHYFCCVGGLDRCDFIGKFENLENDWVLLCNMLKYTYGHLEKTNSTHHGHYLEYMSPEIVKRINQLYRKDFKLFGYEML